MSRSTTALKRLGVPSLAAVTLVAGLPLFLGTASAAHIAGLTLTPQSTSEAAGVCVPYTAQLGFNTGQAPRVEDVDVLLTEDAAAPATQDLTFCTAATDGVTPASPVGATADGGTDRAEFTTDATGKVTFGIVSNVASTAPVVIRAFYEVDGSANDNNRFDAGEFTDTSTATFTAGGTAGSNTNQDAARDVEVVAVGEPTAATSTVVIANTDDEDNVVEGETRTYRVAVRGAANERLAGVTVSFTVDQLSDGSATANTAPASFGVTNNDGIATGTITFPARTGTAPTNDTVTFFVNQSTGTLAGPDGTEPTDELVVTVRDAGSQANRAVTLSPGSRTFSGLERSATFTATVDDPRTTGADTATNGTLLAFTVTGGNGDEFVTATPQTAGGFANECTSATTTGNDSACVITVNDPTPTVGQVLTVTATVRGTSANDTSTLTFVNRVSDARFVSLTPSAVTVAPNTAQQLTATVTDVDGNPVADVFVAFAETGAGAFRNGNSSTGGFTNAAGQVTVETLSLPGETGTQTVTATIDADDTQCENVANVGTDPQGNNLNTTTNTGAAGVCADTSTVTFSNTPASPSATPTAPVDGPNCTPAASVNIIDTTIIATGAGRLSVDAPANSIVQLEAYTRPSTTYRVVRSAEINAAGDDAQFLITPPANTRLRARVVGCSTYGESKVMNVRTALSLFAKRNGVRNYTFSGDSLPARPGGLIISLYRVTASGSQVLTSQVRANATNGEWSLTRQFTGSGRFGFVVRTGQDLQNAPGTSNVRPTLIF